MALHSVLHKNDARRSMLDLPPWHDVWNHRRDSALYAADMGTGVNSSATVARCLVRYGTSVNNTGRSGMMGCMGLLVSSRAPNHKMVFPSFRSEDFQCKGNNATFMASGFRPLTTIHHIINRRNADKPSFSCSEVTLIVRRYHTAGIKIGMPMPLSLLAS